MITLRYQQFQAPFSTEKWAFYQAQMPSDIKNRINRYFKVENKYQLLLGRLLLKKGMHELGYKDFNLADLSYDEFNCPHWRNSPSFSIAHSGNIVGCAFSKKAKIGLDIERIQPIKLADFKHILNDLDYQNIAKAANRDNAFFKIWTIKEAVTKAIGKGLAIDVKAINILEQYAVLENQKWYFQKINLSEKFAIYMVSEVPILKSKVIKETF